MIQISNVKIDLDDDRDIAIRKQIEKIVSGRPFNYRIVKESIDARKKPIKFVYQVYVETDNEDSIIKRDKNVIKVSEYIKEETIKGSTKVNGRVAVVGLGPAGLFAALELARNGYRPVVVESGKDVIRRKGDVENFWETGTLNPE